MKLAATDAARSGAALLNYRLYAALFADGVVKVGITSNPKSRAESLRRLRGKPLAAFHVGPCTCLGFACERLLLSRVARIANLRHEKAGSREWFTCVKFGAVRNLVNQVSTRNAAEAA